MIGGLQCFVECTTMTLDEKLSGHLIAGRLSADEKKKVIDMTKSLTVPQNILTNFKQNNKKV